MNFDNWVPTVIVLGLWVMMIGLMVLMNMFSQRNVVETYDKCKPQDVKYRYLVKLVANPSKKCSYEFLKHAITARILDSKDHFVTTFTIRLAILLRIPDLRNRARVIIRLIVNRSEPLDEFKTVVLDSSATKGSLYVEHMDFIGIEGKTCCRAFIDREIKPLIFKTTSDQQFECKEVEFSGEPEADVQVFKEVEVNEMLVFVYLSLNALLLIESISLNVVKPNDNSFLVIFIISLVSSLAAMVVEIVVVFNYRFTFKAKYFTTYGSEQWTTTCTVYLVGCFIVAVICGTVSIILLSDTSYTSDSKVVHNPVLYYSIICYLILNVLFVVISYLFDTHIFITITQMAKANEVSSGILSDSPK